MPHPVVESLLRRWFANVVIVCTLSLGLGALAVMAALVGAVLFPRVPFTTPERLAVLWGSNRPGAEQPADYLTRQRADRWLAAPPRSLDRLAAYGSTIGVLPREQSSQRINVTAVSGSFFHVLGVKDVRGRVLMAYDSTHATSPALLLSDRAWRKYFHSNPAVIGQVVPIDSTFYTVVGVAPAELNLPRAMDVWLMRASLPVHR